MLSPQKQHPPHTQHNFKKGNTMGDIGKEQREYEFEPLTAPSVPEPVAVPEPEKVPA